jgi:uncharacterized protein (TIGR03000 family)
MIRFNWKDLLVVAVAAVVLSSTVPQANAQCWGSYRPWRAGWYGSCYSCYTPCYTCYSPCGYDCGYLGCRPGPVRRWLFGPYKWYYGCGCGCGCYSTCGGCTTTASAPCCGAGPGATSPAQTPTPAKKPELPPAEMNPTPLAPAPSPSPAPPPTPSPILPKTTSTMSADQSAVLTVWVPYEAKVTINGRETKSIGSHRQYVSYGLQPGLSYKYVVKAQLLRDGQLLEDAQTVVLTAGQVTAVAFGFNVAPAAQVAAR